MAIYKLEQDPTIFITPTYYGNKFVYRMAYVRQSNTRTTIRNIDLRKDVLRVHGSDIKASMLQRLHDSLTIGQKQGSIYVNSNGACYFLLLGNVLCKPIHNVVFDWSPFGVVVPGSINESLRNELIKEKENAIQNINRQLAGSTHAKTLKDMEIELKRVNGQLSLVDFELESSKIELECTKLELESSKRIVVELEHQVSSTIKANEDFVMQVKDLQSQLSSRNDELESTKELLEWFKKEDIEQHHDDHMGKMIKDLSNDINSINSEVRSSKRKIEQVMISMLWNELGLVGYQFDQPRLLQQQPSLMGIRHIPPHHNQQLPVFIKIEDNIND